MVALTLLMSSAPAGADSSSPGLASYYDRHMALVDGVAHGWTGTGVPRRLLDGVRQVGVSKDAYFVLQRDGTLATFTDPATPAVVLMRGVASFAAGASGWRAIDAHRVLWHGVGIAAPRRVAEPVVDACVGDSADYHVTADGRLWVQGLAHRGQYGDGRLQATAEPVATADGVVAVRAHTGHALHLRRDGTVMGTGGNRFGPLSSHGLGDKADRWGPIFERAVAIATGSRHSVALRADGSLWGWGEGFGIVPTQLMDGVAEVAAGDTATIARRRDGSLWQWNGGGAPRRLMPE